MIKYILLLLIMISCNSKDPTLSPLGNITEAPEGTPTPEVTYPIGFWIEGLGSSPIVLSLNGEETLSIAGDGINFFSKQLTLNSPYEITILTQPTDRNCFVKGGAGFISGSTSDVRINCSPTGSYFISGLISGHDTGEIQIQLATYETVRKSAGSSSFGFNWYLTNGSYTLTLNNSGTTKNCVFTSTLTTTATITIAGANVSNVQIQCTLPSTSTPSMSGTITGITGSTIALHTSNGVQITVNSDGIYNLGNFSENKRFLAEIISAPNRYCVFNSSNDHLFSHTPTTAKSDIDINCTTRSTNCSAASGELPSTDGTINDVDCVNGKILYGGAFTLTGRQFGITSVDTTVSTAAAPGTYSMDRIHGKVNKIISDNQGGWFAGGLFSRVGDRYKRNIVRLDSRFIIDESFDIETDGEIVDLDIDGDQLYITGDFTRIIKGTSSTPRYLLARISLATSSPTVVSFTLASGIEASPAGSATSFTTTIIDSNIYIHGRIYNNSSTNYAYILSRRTGTYLLTINKSSGATTGISTALSETGKNLFYKDLNSDVWLLHSDVGMKNSQTLATHPYNAKILYGSNRFYHLDNNELYMTSTTSVNKIDLSTIDTTSATVFGSSISYAANAVSNANTICFFQNPAGATITTGSGPRKGVACFNKSDGGLLTFDPFPSFKQNISSGVFNGNNIITNAQFFSASATYAASVIDASTHSVLTHTNNLTTGSVNQVLNDGTNFYVAGNFLNYSGCANCDHIAKINSTTNSAITTWYLTTPFTSLVNSASIDGATMVISSNDSTKNLVSLNITNDTTARVPLLSLITTAPSSLVLIGGDLITRDTNNITHRSLSDLLPTGVLDTTNSNLIKANGMFVFAQSPFLKLYLPNGTLDHSLNVGPISTSSLVSALGSKACVYDYVSIARCYDTTSELTLTNTFTFSSDWGFTLFKGVGNYLFFSKLQSAPNIKLVP